MRYLIPILCVTVLLTATMPVWAQDDAAAKPDDQAKQPADKSPEPAEQPAAADADKPKPGDKPAPGEGAAPAPAPKEEPKPADAKDVEALVVDVQGSVVYRSASTGGEFKPVTKGMKLSADTLISAGRKAHAILQFGENSAVMLEQLSVMTIQKVYETKVGKEKPTVVTRLKLVNGSVRAGVERGKTDSDFKVTTPVATLSVRGTRPIRVFFDAGTGKLWFYLGSEGKIVAQITPGEDGGPGKVVLLDPGEGTNEDLILAILLAQFLQHNQVGDPWGQTLKEYIVEVFNRNGLDGFGGGNPGDFDQLLREFNGGDSSDSSHGDSIGDSFFPDDED